MHIISVGSSRRLVSDNTRANLAQALLTEVGHIVAHGRQTSFLERYRKCETDEAVMPQTLAERSCIACLKMVL